VHEFGITQEILRAVLEASTAAGATRINTVNVTIGDLTEVVPDALQFAWEALTADTLAGGAVLHIEETQGRSVCLQCSEEFTHDRYDRVCTKCGSFATKVLSGDELRIDDIDVDVPEVPAASGGG
jgi:hydrogenase nickel incorporation protein HypA/HybF